MTKIPRFILPRHTFGEVLGQGDDRVTVRQLLMDLIPEDVKWKIVWHFNKSISERNLRALDILPDMTEELTSREPLSFLADVYRQIDEFRKEGIEPGTVILGFQQMAEARSNHKGYPTHIYGIPVQGDPTFDKVLVIE